MSDITIIYDITYGIITHDQSTTWRVMRENSITYGITAQVHQRRSGPVIGTKSVVPLSTTLVPDKRGSRSLVAR